MSTNSVLSCSDIWIRRSQKIFCSDYEKDCRHSDTVKCEQLPNVCQSIKHKILCHFNGIPKDSKNKDLETLERTLIINTKEMQYFSNLFW